VEQVNVSVLLANFAKVSDNMLDVQQAGWSFVGPGPARFAVAGIAHCSWHEANQRHELKIELVDADGAPVLHPENGQPLMVHGHFEVGRPAGTKPGSSVPMPFAFPFAVPALPPGSQYEMRLSVDGECRDDWRVPFTIRAAPAGTTPPA
jgi:hypothetical protein